MFFCLQADCGNENHIAWKCFTDVLISPCQASHGKKTILQNNWNSSTLKQQHTVLLGPQDILNSPFKRLKWKHFLKPIFIQIQGFIEWSFNRFSAAATSRPQTASYFKGKSLANFMPVSTYYEPLLQPAGNVQRHTLLQHNKKRRGINLEWDSYETCHSV